MDQDADGVGFGRGGKFNGRMDGWPDWAGEPGTRYGSYTGAVIHCRHTTAGTGSLVAWSE